jgi:hypothetical protein
VFSAVTASSSAVESRPIVLSLLALAAGCASSPSPRDAALDTTMSTDGADAIDTAIDQSSSDVTIDVVDTASADVFTPGPHQPLMQIPDQGGPRIHHPALVTITFAGDSRRAELEAYARWIVGSNWLLTTGASYGVGAGTIAGAVVRTETPPATITDVQIENFIATGILDGSIPTPSTGIADAIYIIYYPATTSISGRCGTMIIQSCTQFIGDHEGAHAMGLDFAYAVMPDCGHGIGEVEIALSHEIIEAASDPISRTNPAYELNNDVNDPWFLYMGCEVENGDLCELSPATTYESGHVAQRIWSNAAAAAGADPCVPADPAMPYFNVTATPTTVQHVAPGASIDYQLQGWSTAPVPTWSITTRVLGVPFNENPPTALTASLSAHTLNNGQTATLHVSVSPLALSGSSAAIEVTSALSAMDYHQWVLGVTTP